MNRYDCDTVRDLVPALTRNALLPHEAAAAEAHLESCADCRSEAEIVALIQATSPAVPVGLEARVLLAVRRPVMAAPRRWAPARLAMAATVAAALLGGSYALQRTGVLGPQTDEAGVPLVVLDASAASAFNWAAAEDPLLHGSSDVHELSAEELELLLAELDT
jgi:predicted anti-sigma-YlaC factor YlaD